MCDAEGKLHRTCRADILHPDGQEYSTPCRSRARPRDTPGKSLALPEKMSTITLQASIPPMMAACHIVPGRMSLGASQHRTWWRSSTAQAASAHGLSFFEWLMKTSLGLLRWLAHHLTSRPYRRSGGARVAVILLPSCNCLIFSDRSSTFHTKSESRTFFTDFHCEASLRAAGDLAEHGPPSLGVLGQIPRVARPGQPPGDKPGLDRGKTSGSGGRTTPSGRRSPPR